MNQRPFHRHVGLGMLGLVLMLSVVACSKKNDSNTADAGGGVATKRSVITMEGGAR